MADFFIEGCTRRQLLKKAALWSVGVGGGTFLFDRLAVKALRVPKRPRPHSAGGGLSDFEPAYVKLHQSGELRERADALWAIMEECRLCPRQCGVNRLAGQRGICNAPGAKLEIASFHPHFGEERPLVGSGGSGTIFLTHCNLRCVFCQNWEISQQGLGSERSIEGLAQMMLRLQGYGCHNINLVTPTHYSAPILKAIDRAAGRGLRLPIVYNTSGYERTEIIRQLDGIVDIYLPDFKYWDSGLADKYSSGAASYPATAMAAISEMNRQVGVANPPEDGIMRRGLMIRHLVMPNNTAGSEEVMQWIASNLPNDTYVNIMAQYNPLFKAYDYPELSRRITRGEYKAVVDRARELGLTNLDVQGFWWLLG
jgi:putative pyruvate formate lyase activating enzyme